MSIIAVFIGFIVALSALGGTNYYVVRRLYQCINFVYPQMNSKIYIVIYILLTLVMVLGFARSLLPLPLVIKNSLGVISSYWLGIYVYLLLFFVLADVVLLLGSIFKVIPDLSAAPVRFISGLFVLLLTIATVSYGMYNANQIKHISYDISLKESNLASALKVVMISDLHLGAINSEKRLKNIVQEINNLQPDLVCIPGDIFDNDYHAIRHPEEAITLLKSITATYGVYASPGNHDAGKTVTEMWTLLEQTGIKLLNDEHVIIDEQLVLLGRVDPSPIGGFGDISRKNLTEVMTEVDERLPLIVMDHNPINIDKYGSEVDLILSGHTHRGQIFPAGLVTKLIYTVDYGYYQKDATSPHVIVTSGVGTWGMPMRVGTNCEIVSINLK